MEPETNGQEKAASDRSLLRRYRDGQESAAAELYRRYAQRLHALARAQLSADLARQVDVDDVVQSVFGSFFRGVSDALYDVPAGEELWKLLLVIALNKIRKKAAYHHAARRDMRRTTELDPSLAALIADPQAAGDFLQVVVDEALAALPPPQQRVIASRLEGLQVQEIAVAVGRSKRSVERLLQQACARLSRLLEPEG
jgi:RNA polymerase sigma-70 factor (ECF subfamily)